MGNVCYRRGWLDEAKRYFETACRMDPEQSRVPAGARGLQQPRHTVRRAIRPFATSCGNDVCSNWCLAALCCNLLGGGGYCLSAVYVLI